DAIEQLPTVRRIYALVPAAQFALGLDRPRTYLLLGENDRELRATGGFIGTAGTLTIDRGQVSSFDYGSSYSFDDQVAAPPPPRPLQRYLGISRWYLRDSNWWPDFPSSAEQALEAWRRAGRPDPDSVLAFDTVA